MAATRRADIHSILAEVQALLREDQHAGNLELQNLSGTLTAALDLEPRIVHFSFAKHPEVLIYDGIRMETYEAIARYERDLKRPILMTGAFIASRIAFPEWPQVPQGTVRSNTGNLRDYPVKHLRSERDRQIDTAEDIREYRYIANQILNAVAGHLTLPNLMIKNIRQNCIEIYNITRPPLKNPVYRRWQEYSAAPTLHDAVGMYSIGLGRFHPRFAEALRVHGQQWLIWEEGMRPILGPRYGDIHAYDAAIRPTGQTDMVNPYRPPHKDLRVAMQEAYADRFGHFYNNNIFIRRQLERIDEVVEASQVRGQLIPAVRYQK